MCSMAREAFYLIDCYSFEGIQRTCTSFNTGVKFLERANNFQFEFLGN